VPRKGQVAQVFSAAAGARRQCAIEVQDGVRQRLTTHCVAWLARVFRGRRLEAGGSRPDPEGNGICALNLAPSP